MTMMGHIIKDNRMMPVRVRKHRALGVYGIKRRVVGRSKAAYEADRYENAIGPRLHRWEQKIGMGDYQCLLADEVVFYRIGE